MKQSVSAIPVVSRDHRLPHITPSGVFVGRAGVTRTSSPHEPSDSKDEELVYDGGFSLLGEPGSSLMTRDSLRAFFGERQHRFVMTFASSIATNGSGLYLATIPISPAIVSYLEWGSLSALFDEIKLVSTTVQFRPKIGSDGQLLSSSTATKAVTADTWAGFDWDNLSTAPASFSAVIRLGSARSMQRCVGDDSGQSRFTQRTRPGLGWARIATPGTQDPPAGVIGCWMIASGSPQAATTSYYDFVMKTEVILRCRL
jgi:hypothetical protein